MDFATRRITELLAPLTNYERERPDRARFGLETMRALLASPMMSAPDAILVQIGGSKGKGSTALYLEHLAQMAGLQVGVYLSPHLQSILERVRLRGAQVSEGVLRRSLETVLACARSIGVELSFFEAMTAAALDCFDQDRVDLGILEVGLGGRLDATTAVEVQASILTNVEREHSEILGDTIAEIAGEKAHVIRPRGLCFTSASGEALAVFVARAKAVGAELRILGQDFGIEGLHADGEDWLGRLWCKQGSSQEFRLAGAASIELEALTLAWACFGCVFPKRRLDLSELRRPELPGRFEVICDSGRAPMVLDGAHTEVSLHILGQELNRRFGTVKRRFLYATAVGKRWREGLGSILGIADEVYVTGLRDTRSEDPATICSFLRAAGFQAHVVPDVATGLKQLQASDELAVVTGSFYLVGEVRELVMR